MVWDYFQWLFPARAAQLDRITRNVEIIMATVADVQAKLDAANTRLDGIQGDIINLKQQIADLQTSGGGATPAEIEALLTSATALADKAGVIDDQTT